MNIKDLRKSYQHLPCPKCQAVGNYQFKEGRIICMSCGKELTKF